MLLLASVVGAAASMAVATSEVSWACGGRSVQDQGVSGNVLFQCMPSVVSCHSGPDPALARGPTPHSLLTHLA
jgi:hypothetical protein